MNLKSNPKKVGISLIASGIIGAIVSMFSFYYRTDLMQENTLNSLNTSKIYFILMMVISFVIVYIIYSLLENSSKKEVIQKKKKSSKKK